MTKFELNKKFVDKYTGIQFTDLNYKEDILTLMYSTPAYRNTQFRRESRSEIKGVPPINWRSRWPKYTTTWFRTEVERGRFIPKSVKKKLYTK